MHVPMLLARLLRSGAFIHRDVIVVGACGDPAIKEVDRGFQQGAVPHLMRLNSMLHAAPWNGPMNANAFELHYRVGTPLGAGRNLPGKLANLPSA